MFVVFFTTATLRVALRDDCAGHYNTIRVLLTDTHCSLRYKFRPTGTAITGEFMSLMNMNQRGEQMLPCITSNRSMKPNLPTETNTRIRMKCELGGADL